MKPKKRSRQVGLIMLGGGLNAAAWIKLVVAQGFTVRIFKKHVEIFQEVK